jgi:flagella basal body P-ring formation protein FlgA
MRILFLFLLSFGSILFADVNRFIDSIDFPESHTTNVITKSSAFISSGGSPVLRSFGSNQLPQVQTIILDRETLEKRLGESIAHRYQSSGRIAAFVTREWTPVKVSSNYLIKISDCTPDELCPSTFTRFSIWDNGNLVGQFAEPLRVAQYVDVFFSDSPITRGARLNASQLISRPVDVLKQFAGAVPVNANIRGYQLSTNIRANTPIKWNYLSKVTLVKKGQLVDVFASGNGIYVTMKGKALEDGVEGGNVTVENLSSSKKFQAKVLNENSVKVHL